RGHHLEAVIHREWRVKGRLGARSGGKEAAIAIVGGAVKAGAVVLVRLRTIVSVKPVSYGDAILQPGHDVVGGEHAVNQTDRLLAANTGGGFGDPDLYVWRIRAAVLV